MNTNLTRIAAGAFACALSLTALPTTALACGGFFCFTQPVDQSAERVLYVQDGDKIAVHIQISYTGKDEQFSWILPLPSAPTLGIGSDSIFQILEQETAPRFTLQWNNTNNCYGYQPCYRMDATGAGGGGPPNKNGGGVEVLDQGNVGPYDYVTLKSGSASELIEWLNKNKYVQPAESEPLIKSYVDKKHVFLALKLAKDSDAGDIAPIVVKLDESSPCLPIRLTKIAAQPDMPIVAWTLGPHRGVPKNFLHVVINEATLDWMKPGANYKTVVSKAVDQASGHAFTTEYAKKTDAWKRKFSSDTWKTGANSVAELAKQPSSSASLQMLLQGGYPRTTQTQNLIKKHVPKPAKYKDVKDQEFYNCLSSSGNTSSPCSDYKAEVAKQTWNAQAFADDVQKNIVEPLVGMDDDIKGHAWMTRLYTTVDPQEMDKDPIFAFNKDLPAVDNQHTAKADPICEGAEKQAKKAKLTFADGHVVTLDIPKDDNCTYDFAGGATAFGKGTEPLVKAGGQPAQAIEVLDESGPPLAVHPDDAERVDAQLNTAVAGKESLSEEFRKTLKKADWDYKDENFKPSGTSSGASTSGGSTSGGSTSGGSTSGGSTSGGATSSGGSSGSGGSGCSTSGHIPTPWGGLLLLGLLGVAAVWRRRIAGRA